MLSKYKGNTLDVSQLQTCKICFDRPMFFSAIALNAHTKHYHHAETHSPDSSDDEGTLHEKLLLKLEQSKQVLCEQLKSSQKQLLTLEKMNGAPQTLNLLKIKIENIKKEIVGKSKKIEYLRVDDGVPTSSKSLNGRYYENMAQKLINKNIDENFPRRSTPPKTTSLEGVNNFDTLSLAKEPRLSNIEKRLEELENELEMRKSTQKGKEPVAKQHGDLNKLKETLKSTQQKNKLEFDGLIKKTVVNLREQIEITKAQFDKKNFGFGNVDMENTSNNNKFVSLKYKIEHLTSEHMTLKEINNVFEEELKNAMTQEHRSKKQISKIILEYAKIFNENEQYEKQIQELKKVKEMHTNSITELINKVQYLESQNKTYEDSLQELKIRYEKVLEQCHINESRLKIAKQEYEEKVSKLRDHFAAKQEQAVVDTESFIQEIDDKYKEEMKMMENMLFEEKGEFKKLQADYERSQHERHENEKQLEDYEHKLKCEALENVNLKVSEELVHTLKIEKKDLMKMISVIRKKFMTAEQQVKEEQSKSLAKIDTLNEKIRQLSLEKFDVDRVIERETKQLQKKLDEQIALVVQLKKEKSTIKEKQLKNHQVEEFSGKLRVSNNALKLSEDKVAKLTKRLIEVERVNCDTAIQNSDMIQKICHIQEELRVCDMEKLIYKNELQEKNEKFEKLQSHMKDRMQRQLSEKKFISKIPTSTKPVECSSVREDILYNKRIPLVYQAACLSGEEDDQNNSSIRKRKTIVDEESIFNSKDDGDPAGAGDDSNIETSSITNGKSSPSTGQRRILKEKSEANNQTKESSITNQYAVDSKDIIFSPSQIGEKKDVDPLLLSRQKFSHNRSSCSTVLSSARFSNNQANLVTSEKVLARVYSEKAAIKDRLAKDCKRNPIAGEYSGCTNHNARESTIPSCNIRRFFNQNEKVDESVTKSSTSTNKIEELMIKENQSMSESTESNILSAADVLAPPNKVEELTKEDQSIVESTENNILNVEDSLAPANKIKELLKEDQGIQSIEESSESEVLDETDSSMSSDKIKELLEEGPSTGEFSESQISDTGEYLMPSDKLKRLLTEDKSIGESSESEILNVTDSVMQSHKIKELFQENHDIGEFSEITSSNNTKEFLREHQNKGEYSGGMNKNVIDSTIPSNSTSNTNKFLEDDEKGEYSGYKHLSAKKSLTPSSNTNKFFARITSLSNRTNGLLTLGTLPLLQQSFSALLNNGVGTNNNQVAGNDTEDEDDISMGEVNALLSELDDLSDDNMC